MITPAEALAPTPTSHGSSRWREFRRCQHAHYLRYTQGVELAPIPTDESDLLVPPEDSPHADVRPDYRSVGILVHACMRYWGEGNDRWIDVIDAAREGVGGVALSRTPVVSEAEWLMAGYYDRYGHMVGNVVGFDGDEWRVVGVEKVFDSRDCSGADSWPVPLTARADLLLESRDDGLIVIVDHKTRSKRFSDNRSRELRIARTDAEFLGLSYLVRHTLNLSYYPAIWINGLVKLKIPDFQRLYVPLDGRPEIEGFAQVMRHDGYAHNEISRRNLASCAPMMGEACWAYQHCWGTEESRERYYQIKKKDHS